MNKFKAFFGGLILIIVTFAIVFVTVLMYRANSQLSVETYIFQMDNSANQRVGPLQDINTMRPEGLRNKLIQKYIAEYFKVIPSSSSNNQNAGITVQGSNIVALSSPDVYNKWLESEAKTINEMSKTKVFRNVWVAPENIKPAKAPDWFEVQYVTKTWSESNNMSIPVIDDFGTVMMHVIFKPGFNPNKNIRKSLENGENPAKLFMFKVIDIQKIWGKQ